MVRRVIGAALDGSEMTLIETRFMNDKKNQILSIYC